MTGCIAVVSAAVVAAVDVSGIMPVMMSVMMSVLLCLVPVSAIEVLLFVAVSSTATATTERNGDDIFAIELVLQNITV